VRVSDKPADADHQYGHGKFENFSAFIETGLLLLTCVWIVYEAIKRLFFHSVEIEPACLRSSSCCYPSPSMPGVRVLSDASRRNTTVRLWKPTRCIFHRHLVERVVIVGSRWFQLAAAIR